MKYAADFRRIAREALRGKWPIAVLVGLVAVLLGGAVSSGPEVEIDIDVEHVNASFGFAGQTLFSAGGPSSGFRAFLVGSAIYLIVAAVILAVIYFVLGSVIEVGYARFNLELVDRRDPSFETLFGYFSFWKTAAAARLHQSIYILLWSLLLVIPGIVASYSYAMTGYILAEAPELTASEAIARSKELMAGNRWRLFCLQLSFIGWGILCMLTLGIGNLWLTPYERAAEAAFYREITGADDRDPIDRVDPCITGDGTPDL